MEDPAVGLVGDELSDVYLHSIAKTAIGDGETLACRVAASSSR